ncbi:MAG: DUF2247 family protein [Clostridiales bacterium]|jgi:hypothetical protein|nr:DUF2247 family protein [Clostridiales bacterium]
MGFPTNKITEEQIRKLVSESKNSFNPLNLMFTYEYATNLVMLNWNDIHFATSNGFLAYEAAIDHAVIDVQMHKNPTNEVLELACMLREEAKFPHIIRQYVDKLVTKQNALESIEKFMYISLSWVYEHKDDYCNLIEVVDILCDESYYPNEVKSLISFMPKSDSTLNGLINRLELYFNNQLKRWSRTDE